jgi:hypothetical protein
MSSDWPSIDTRFSPINEDQKEGAKRVTPDNATAAATVFASATTAVDSVSTSPQRDATRASKEAETKENTVDKEAMEEKEE